MTIHCSAAMITHRSTARHRGQPPLTMLPRLAVDRHTDHSSWELLHPFFTGVGNKIMGLSYSHCSTCSLAMQMMTALGSHADVKCTSMPQRTSRLMPVQHLINPFPVERARSFRSKQKISNLFKTNFTVVICDEEHLLSSLND